MADAAAAVAEHETVKLQVAGSRQEESGHGFARISRDVMTRLGITEGDIVEIASDGPRRARCCLIPRTKVSR
jgi:transitional endoplasmic reticulum ATPase